MSDCEFESAPNGQRASRQSMIRANYCEDEEAKMARFLNGLNHDICDVVELQHYVDFDDLVQQAMKVEQQLKRKSTMKKFHSSFPSSSWKDKPKREGTSTYSKEQKVNVGKEVSNSKPFKNVSSFNPNANKPRTSDIKCFKCLGRGHIASQCPTKKSMIMRGVDAFSSEESSSSEGEEIILDDVETFACEGDLLMVRRLLGSQIRDCDDSQRENIFHTRCLILGKTCSLIIDGGSCANVASARLVEKLSLQTTPHPRPYKLQWLSEEGEMIVNKQVLINLTIGKYVDDVLCDVVPMEAGHILLGRPWQYDRKVHHDGYTNKFSYVHNSHTIILVPLSPREVGEDQIKLKLKREQEKQEKSIKEKGKEKNQNKGEKKRGKENDVKVEKKLENHLMTKCEVKQVLYANQPMFICYYNDLCLNVNTNPLPSEFELMLQGFDDVFPKEMPSGLPPLRGIEHQIDLIPSASLPNRPAYRSSHKKPRKSKSKWKIS
jgi:hypothetical protein